MATNTKLKVYDPSEVVVSYGVSLIEGFADGTFVVCARDEDSYSLQVGTDGEATRSKSNNRSGTMTITLMQGSLSNDVLSALHIADENSTGGASILPFLVKDLNGRTLTSAQTAWIQKPADDEFGREAGPREWVLRTNNLDKFTGGNTQL